MRLDRLSTLVVPGNEAPRGAIAGLANEVALGLFPIRFADLPPHLSVGIAKASKGAKALRVRERQGGTGIIFACSR
jgi:hypothetical protein